MAKALLFPSHLFSTRLLEGMTYPELIVYLGQLLHTPCMTLHSNKQSLNSNKEKPFPQAVVETYYMKYVGVAFKLNTHCQSKVLLNELKMD